MEQGVWSRNQGTAKATVKIVKVFRIVQAVY
jgi:hypothetical protein